MKAKNYTSPENNEIIEAATPRRWYIDRVFVRGGETYDRGYYLDETGTITWYPPIAGHEPEEFPVGECSHEDGLPILAEDGELLGEEVGEEKKIVSIKLTEESELLALEGYGGVEFWLCSQLFGDVGAGAVGHTE